MRYATITHDLNSLLTAIQGNISLILSNPNLDHECHRRLENIKEYIERSASLISQILSERKNNATLPGKKNRPIGIKDISKIIEDQVQLHRPILESHHIKVHLELGSKTNLAESSDKCPSGNAKRR